MPDKAVNPIVADRLWYSVTYVAYMDPLSYEDSISSRGQGSGMSMCASPAACSSRVSDRQVEVGSKPSGMMQYANMRQD